MLERVSPVVIFGTAMSTRKSGPATFRAGASGHDPPTGFWQREPIPGAINAPAPCLPDLPDDGVPFACEVSNTVSGVGCSDEAATPR